MLKATTASYVLELELRTSKSQFAMLNKKMRIAKQIYNACLGEARKRLRAVLADRDYRFLVVDKKAKNRSRRLKEIERAYGYSEYQLHKWSARCKHHFEGQLGINEVQKLSTRAFQAMEKIHYRKARRVRFKTAADDMSVENKSNSTGLRRKDNQIVWGKLKMGYILKPNDEYAHLALRDKTKYVRIICREIRGRKRYFVQLVQEGLPPSKRNRKVPEDETSTVGIDIGPSTAAIVGDDEVVFAELAEGAKADALKLRRMERAMERSKRATNPDHYHENGVAKKRSVWIYSKRYMKLKGKRRDVHRMMAAKRKQAHETLANEVLALGTDVRVETMRFQSLQRRAKKTTRNKKNGKINKKKRFGKSIQYHAPAMFLSIIDRKLGYQGKAIKKLDTYAVKASQFNHVTGEYTKKQLSERWNTIQGKPVQRDLYSAFLIANTIETLDSVDTAACATRWNTFLKLHDREVERIKNSSNQTLRWLAA